MAKPSLSVDVNPLILKVDSEATVINITTDGTISLEYDEASIKVEAGETDNQKKVTGLTAGTSVLTIKSVAADAGDQVEENTATLEVPVTVDLADGKALLTLSETSPLSIREDKQPVEVTVTTTVDDFEVISGTDSVATVEKVTGGEGLKFKVTPVAVGESDILVSVTSKSNVETEITLKVNVTAKPNLEVNPTEISTKVNKEVVINVTTNSASALSYTIEPSNLATFDVDSKTFKAINVGTGKLTIFTDKGTDDELSKEISFTIAEADVTQLEVSPTNPTIIVGGTVELTVTTNASDYTVSNTNTTSVSFDKVTRTITANAVGSATLTFTAKYGEGEEVSKQVVVTVEAAPVEPTYLDVTTTTPLSVVKGDTRVFTIDTNAEDYEVELNNSTLGSYSKETKTLTTLQPGSLTIKFKATKEGSDTVEKSFTLEIADVTLSATVTELELKVGEAKSFDIESNVLTEATAEATDSEKIAIAKNNNRVTVNGLEIGDTTIVLTARDKTVVVAIKVYVDTVLTVSAQPAQIYVGKDIALEVTTNAESYEVESEHVGIVGVVKEGNIVTLSSVSDGVSNITIKATANGGKEVVITWPITSIRETNYSREEVDKILTDSKTSLKEKIFSFANDKSEYGLFVNNLIAYNTAMDPNNEETLTDEKGAAKNYNLYIQIKDAIETEDYLAFKSKFDLINMVYTVFNKGAFNEFALFRYDQAWAAKWGNISLTTFQNLNTLITSLCDINTRASELSSLSLDKSLDLTKIELSELGANNIKKYYTV